MARLEQPLVARMFTAIVIEDVLYEVFFRFYQNTLSHLITQSTYHVRHKSPSNLVLVPTTINPVLVPDPPYYKYTHTPTTPSIPETLQTSAAETPPEVDLPRDPLHSPHAHHPRLSAKVPSDNNFMIPISRGDQQLELTGTTCGMIVNNT